MLVGVGNAMCYHPLNQSNFATVFSGSGLLLPAGIHLPIKSLLGIPFFHSLVREQTFIFILGVILLHLLVLLVCRISNHQSKIHGR